LEVCWRMKKGIKKGLTKTAPSITIESGMNRYRYSVMVKEVMGNLFIPSYGIISYH
jgi:hypothetical protein